MKSNASYGRTESGRARARSAPPVAGRESQPQLVHSARQMFESRLAKYSDPQNLEWDFNGITDYWERHAFNAFIDLLVAESAVAEKGRVIDNFRADYTKKLHEIERLSNELSVVNGSACAEEQADGNGPCGICRTCLRATQEQALNKLNTIANVSYTELRSSVETSQEYAPSPGEPRFSGEGPDVKSFKFYGTAAEWAVAERVSGWFQKRIREVVADLESLAAAPPVSLVAEGEHKRIACEIAHRHAPLDVQLPLGINALEADIVKALDAAARQATSEDVGVNER